MSINPVKTPSKPPPKDTREEAIARQLALVPKLIEQNSEILRVLAGA
jgi:hypothetical protein